MENQKLLYSIFTNIPSGLSLVLNVGSKSEITSGCKWHTAMAIDFS